MLNNAVLQVLVFINEGFLGPVLIFATEIKSVLVPHEIMRG